MKINNKIKFSIYCAFFLFCFRFTMSKISHPDDGNFYIYPIIAGVIVGVMIGRMKDNLIKSVSEKTLSLQNSEKNLIELNANLENSKKLLEKKIDELERFKRLTIRREYKMIELKNKIKLLSK